MRTGVIVGVAHFVVDFSYADFKVLFDCARNHYSSDVRVLLDRAGPAPRNGLITQIENYFSNMANYDGSHVCTMQLSFRDVDLFLKTLESAHLCKHAWRERDFLAFMEMNELFKKLLSRANDLKWTEAVKLEV